jgi:hypothetical protein
LKIRINVFVELPFHLAVFSYIPPVKSDLIKKILLVSSFGNDSQLL